MLDEKRYQEIIMTRATVSVGEDIGFLPGTEEEKMAPWMGALEDNLKVLSHTGTTGGDWGRAATQNLIRNFHACDVLGGKPKTHTCTLCESRCIHSPMRAL